MATSTNRGRFHGFVQRGRRFTTLRRTRGTQISKSLAAALAAEVASSDRLHALVASLDRNLHRLVAQLNDAVNRAVAVAFGPIRDAGLGSLVAQLEELREAFADSAARLE